MQVLKSKSTRQIVVLETEEDFMIPSNCWAFEELPDGKRVLITETSVSGARISRLVLVPKVAGG